MGVVLTPQGLEVSVGDRLLLTTFSLLQCDDVSFKVLVVPVQEQVVDFLLLLEERQLLHTIDANRGLGKQVHYIIFQKVTFLVLSEGIVHTVGRDDGTPLCRGLRRPIAETCGSPLLATMSFS